MIINGVLNHEQITEMSSTCGSSSEAENFNCKDNQEEQKLPEDIKSKHVASNIICSDKDQMSPSIANEDSRLDNDKQDSDDGEQNLIIEEGGESKDKETCSKRKGQSANVTSSKKIKYLKEVSIDEDDPNIDLDEKIEKLRIEIKTVALIIQQKEEEWNDLLVFQKKKELAYELLLRKKKLQNITQNINASSRPETPTNPTVTDSNLDENAKPSVSFVDIRTTDAKFHDKFPRVSMSIDTDEKLTNELSSMLIPNCSTDALNENSTNSTGFGPQGPTVNVQDLIDAHRRDNPTLPPIRGSKRGWKNRPDGSDKSSPKPQSMSYGHEDLGGKARGASGRSLSISDPSISYRDVLLHFAQMTQSNGNLNRTPQVSIIPLTKSVSSAPTEEETPVIRAHPLNGERTSALAKLLLESQSSTSSNDGERNSDRKDDSSSQHITLSTLLSGNVPSTLGKDEHVSSEQNHGDTRKAKKEEGNPKCQGCHKQKAQFVCAGCGNQWYCSRLCQVEAWDNHADHCRN